MQLKLLTLTDWLGRAWERRKKFKMILREDVSHLEKPLLIMLIEFALGFVQTRVWDSYAQADQLPCSAAYGSSPMQMVTWRNFLRPFLFSGCVKLFVGLWIYSFYVRRGLSFSYYWIRFAVGWTIKILLICYSYLLEDSRRLYSHLPIPKSQCCPPYRGGWQYWQSTTKRKKL